MESPVVLDKPPEYHGNERGFPFEDEDGSGAWSELAARHPDIAARLRQRPSTWARKRRPSSQDAEDFGEGFSGFDRFPFEDIPPEFREHFPTHWNRRFGSREEQPHQPQQSHQSHQPQQSQQSHQPQQSHQSHHPEQTFHPPQHQSQAQHQTAATQTEADVPEPEPQQSIPQYGLRNTVDLGQKSALDPSLVDADDRNQRSMSAPPDNRANMSSQSHPQENQQPHPQQQQQPSNVRVIPIMVEGRDEPVINRNVDHGTHFGDSTPSHAPPHPHPHPHSHPHPQPHIDRDQYFNDDGPISYSTPPNFSRSFGTPFNKFRQGPQPFVQQKVYPQSATTFAKGASPQRSQSPKPPQPQHEEHFVKVPVHHEPSAPKPEPQARQQPKPQQQQHQPPPQQQPQQQQQQQAPPPPPKPAANDPITQILAIQTDVLNLMSDVENFKGSKKDKSYMYLDEMLTRNLIKLDNIETEGKENIRQARKEAIKCIQKCIAVLEAKAAEGSAALAQAEGQTQEGGMKESSEEKPEENGEVEMAEPKEAQVENQPEQPKEEEKQPEKPAEVPANQEAVPPAADTRPEEKSAEPPVENKDNVENKEKEKVDKKGGPKKGAKNVKKRDKSKDKEAAKQEIKGEAKKEEPMQVDDKADSQKMEVDAPSQ